MGCMYADPNVVRALVSYGEVHLSEGLPAPWFGNRYECEGMSLDAWWVKHLMTVHLEAFELKYPQEEHPVLEDTQHFRRDQQFLNYPQVHLQTVKMAQWYVYQADHHPEWEEKPAKAFCHDLIHKAIVLIPGYNELAWGYPNLEVTACPQSP